jgi:hypothetical protein
MSVSGAREGMNRWQGCDCWCLRPTGHALEAAKLVAARGGAGQQGDRGRALKVRRGEEQGDAWGCVGKSQLMAMRSRAGGVQL